jgi:hypothetical protein
MNNAFRITGSGLTVVANKTAYVFSVYIACSAVSGVLSLEIRNNETPNPKILVPAYPLEVAPTDPTHPTNPRSFDWIKTPKLMKKGIVIQGIGSGTGDVTVWIDYGTTEVSAT